MTVCVDILTYVLSFSLAHFDPSAILYCDFCQHLSPITDPDSLKHQVNLLFAKCHF